MNKTESSIANQASWESEAWFNTRSSDRRLIAYIVGRLLNCYVFHAQQAWMLSFGGDGFSASSHGEAAARALRQIKLLVSRSTLASASRVTRAVSRAIRKWEEASISPWEQKQFGEYNHGRDEEEYLEDSSRTSRIKRFVECTQPAWRDWATSLRQRILDDIAEKSWLELGECLDAGIRRPDVYLYMWLEAQPPMLRPGEEFHQGDDGRTWITLTRFDKPAEGRDATADDWQFVAFRSVNMFANCSREAGDLPPEAGWYFGLMQRLRASGLEVPAVKGGDEMSGVPTSKSELLELAAGVDRNIRGLLAPTVPSWDGKILWFGEETVKDLRKQPNSNQGKLFEEFQQHGWPAEIPNPFKHSNPQHAAFGAFDVVELKQTIKGCNRNQRTPLLKFAKAKEGRAVAWGHSNS